MADISLNYSKAALGTDNYGDLLIADGDLRLTSDTAQGAAYGNEPVSQAVAQRLRLLQGEWFLDTSIGVPFFQECLGRKAPTPIFEKAVQDAVLSVPGVVSLLLLELDVKPNERRINIIVRAQTTTGQIVWNGSLNPQAGG